MEERAGDSSHDRFHHELEFLCALAQPDYLHWLSVNLYFDDPSFVRYLKYLLYWNQPAYCKYVIWPHSLYFLDLLQHESFRQSLKNPHYKDHISSQQFHHWKFAKSNKVKQLQERMDEDAGVKKE